jgi:hypothetical protein
MWGRTKAEVNQHAAPPLGTGKATDVFHKSESARLFVEYALFLINFAVWCCLVNRIRVYPFKVQNLTIRASTNRFMATQWPVPPCPSEYTLTKFSLW